MYVAKKRDREVRCILVIMWSAASLQPRHAYAHNKKNIVLQYCFVLLLLVNKNMCIPNKLDNWITED